VSVCLIVHQSANAIPFRYNQRNGLQVSAN